MSIWVLEEVPREGLGLLGSTHMCQGEKIGGMKTLYPYHCHLFGVAFIWLISKVKWERAMLCSIYSPKIKIKFKWAGWKHGPHLFVLLGLRIKVWLWKVWLRLPWQCSVGVMMQNEKQCLKFGVGNEGRDGWTAQHQEEWNYGVNPCDKMKPCLVFFVIAVLHWPRVWTQVLYAVLEWIFNYQNNGGRHGTGKNLSSSHGLFLEILYIGEMGESLPW